MNGMSFTRRLSLSWTALNRTIEAEVWMGPSEEEEDGNEEEEEVLFILGNMKKEQK